MQYMPTKITIVVIKDYICPYGNNLPMPQVFKVDYATRNKIDQIKTVIKLYAVLKRSRVSDLQITLLAYLILYGITERTREFIISELRLCSTLNSYKKAMTVLKRERMLVRDEYNTRYEISPDIKMDPKDNVVMIIRIHKPKVEAPV